MTQVREAPGREGWLAPLALNGIHRGGNPLSLSFSILLLFGRLCRFDYWREDSENMTSETPERIVTIFGGAKCGELDPEYQQARRVGQLLADAGFTICTGGYLG